MLNHGAEKRELTLRAVAYGPMPLSSLTLEPGAKHTLFYPIARNDHWYDLVVEDQRGGWRRRLAGHVETGQPSRSDPAFGQS